MNWIILYLVTVLIEISFNINIFIKDRHSGGWTSSNWVSAILTTIIAPVTLCFQIGSIIYGLNCSHE